jgi:hypothetical protein
LKKDSSAAQHADSGSTVVPAIPYYKELSSRTRDVTLLGRPATNSRP